MGAPMDIALIILLALLLGGIGFLLHKRQIKRERYRLLDRLPLAAVELTPENHVNYLNATAAHLMSVSPKQTLGQSIQRLPSPWPARFQSFEDSPGKATKVFEDVEQVVVFFDAGQSDTGRILLIEDRSELLLSRDKLAHTHRLASLGQLAAGVAHEIGNPLTSIDSLAQLLPPSESETQTLIRTQTNRISAIIQSLLKFSKDEAADAVSNTTETNELLAEAVRLFRLDNRHRDLNIVFEPESTGLWQGDAVGLTQVVINLMNNAAQAMAQSEHATLTLTSRVTESEWRLSVVDTGPGVPEHLREHLFEPFTTSRGDEGGTGLGLALCYGIVQRHRGRIWLDQSGPEEGARFSIRLPLMG